MIRFTAVLSANPAPASAKTRPRQKLRFGDLASAIARSVLTIVLFDNERGGRREGREVPISCTHDTAQCSFLACHRWLGSLNHFAPVAQRLVRSAAPGCSSAVCVDIVIGEEPGHGTRRP